MATEHRAVLLDWGGVMTSDLFGSFAAFCAEEGLDPDLLANLFRHDLDARALLIDFECGRIEEADFEPRLSTALGLTWHDGLIDRLFAGAGLDQAMVDGVARAARARRAHRPGLELLGHAPLSARPAGRALRRHRHLGRGGLPQARPAHVRARRAAHRRRARPSASSSTTSRSTWTPRASWGWRWCITRRRRRRWRSWSGWWVSAAPANCITEGTGAAAVGAPGVPAGTRASDSVRVAVQHL